MVVSPVTENMDATFVVSTAEPMLMVSGLVLSVAVLLKLLEVMVKALAPVEIEEAARPDKSKDPEVASKLRSPVVSANPLEAVNVSDDVNEPLLSVIIPDLPREIETALVVPI